MVPDRMIKAEERYTGKWWFAASRPRLWGRPQIRIIMEVEEGWTWMTPPMPGREPVIDWRRTSRTATEGEVMMLQFANRGAFQYAPPQ